MPQRQRRTPDTAASRARRALGRSERFAVDVSDRGDELLVSAELPGLRKQDIDVIARRNEMEIVADFGEDEEGRYLRKERERGEVRRVVRLPKPIDEKHVSASYEDGVLWVTLQKRDQPTQVEIQ